MPKTKYFLESNVYRQLSLIMSLYSSVILANKGPAVAAVRNKQLPEHIDKQKQVIATLSGYKFCMDSTTG